MNNIAALLIWVSQISGYPIPENTPEPKFDYANIYSAFAATTSFIDGKITLQKSFHTMDKEQQHCTIAHELTHYLQFVNKVQFNNICELEPPAYAVETTCFHMYLKDENEKWSLEQADNYRTCK